MNPKSGKAGKTVAPAKPAEAYDADVADPGKAAEGKAQQAQSKTGKYGSEQPKPHKPAQETQEEKQNKKSWIEIELVNEAGDPVPGEGYEITLPNGLTTKGTLDSKGLARLDGIDPGTCKVTFPNLDKEAWKKA
jgi:type VI secretion system secreted protein VgrG